MCVCVRVCVCVCVQQRMENQLILMVNKSVNSGAKKILLDARKFDFVFLYFLN